MMAMERRAIWGSGQELWVTLLRSTVISLHCVSALVRHAIHYSSLHCPVPALCTGAARLPQTVYLRDTVSEILAPLTPAAVPAIRAAPALSMQRAVRKSSPFARVIRGQNSYTGGQLVHAFRARQHALKQHARLYGPARDLVRCLFVRMGPRRSLGLQYADRCRA